MSRESAKRLKIWKRKIFRGRTRKHVTRSKEAQRLRWLGYIKKIEDNGMIKILLIVTTRLEIKSWKYLF